MGRDAKERALRVPRRTVLRGLGGMVVTLPFLEYFAPTKAAAQVIPKRWLYAFAGCSTGMDGGDSVTPATTGVLADRLTRGLAPLGTHGVADVTTAVSRLYVPWDTGGGVPPGGRIVQFHSSTPCALASGVRSTGTAMRGPTSEWIAAESIGAGTKFPALSYRVQARSYRGGNAEIDSKGRISARLVNGSLQQVEPTVSPRVAYESLFTGFVPPDPVDAAAAKALLARRKSVIDLVGADTERLLKRLGAADKQRMQQHFDEIRALENRLDQVSPVAEGACAQFPHPGDDPAIGGPVENGTQGDGGPYDSTAAYSGEERRAEVFVDLIHMAFTCDLSRSASLLFTYAQCFMNMNPLYGHPSDLHEISHFSMGGGKGGQDALADGVAWHVGHWARLLKKLRDTEDADGSRILDHTAAVLVFEGGVGYDPEQNGQGSPHSTENMVVLLAGKAGGLHAAPGQHLERNGMHPVAVVNRGMQAVGIEGTLGEVSAVLDAV